MRALRSADTFRGDASPVTWLYRVTTNYCLGKIREDARRQGLLSRRGQPDESAAPSTPDDRMTVSALLHRTPEDLREIAIYHYIDELNHDEIAGMMGVSRRTVGNRLEEFRAFARDAAGLRMGAA